MSPLSAITQANLGRLLGPAATFSIFMTTKRPSPRTPWIEVEKNKYNFKTIMYLRKSGEEKASK
jgi:hypothetical protein